MSNTIGIVLIVIISILLLFVIGLLILFFIKPNHKGIAANETTEKKLADIMLQNQSLKTQLETMQKTYANLNETINQTGSASVKNIATLSEKIETLDKFQKDLNKYNGEIKTNLETLFDVTKTIPTISSEIKGIADIYKNAKQRGSFGEFQLSTILKDIFGADSNLVMSQYSLKNGGVVDFIVKVGEHIVPIDAKFPLDNYKKIDQSENANDIDRYKQQFKRDVIAKFKEASKYISPVEGIDNVIIFIPSEGIFGNIIE
jgi:DNA recombination protein RmuC